VGVVKVLELDACVYIWRARTQLKWTQYYVVRKGHLLNTTSGLVLGISRK